MSAHTTGNLTGHAYDGIQEYDNPTPGWWHLLFWGTIFFSAIYGAFFHFSEFAWDEHQVLGRDQTAYFARLFGDLGELEGTPDTLTALMADPKWMAVGQSIFARNCTQCHGAEGGGVNGPNLTDDSYKNLKTIQDVFRVVTEGVVEKGMPAWKSRLQQNERIVVAAYAANLRGKTAAAGKPAEGDFIPPWPAPPAGGLPKKK